MMGRLLCRRIGFRASTSSIFPTGGKQQVRRQALHENNRRQNAGGFGLVQQTFALNGGGFFDRRRRFGFGHGGDFLTSDQCWANPMAQRNNSSAGILVPSLASAESTANEAGLVVRKVPIARLRAPNKMASEKGTGTFCSADYAK